MAGTTGSSGLNNLLADTQQVQTTLPSWYDTAQQNIVSKANLGLGNTPQFQNTTAQGAVDTLQGANNPFTQAQGNLNQIATGAANPWITNAAGNVTPNTNTALGGLFQAQNQQLNQLMPNIQAQQTGSNIASGQFGSLRGQTAEDKAMADAQSNLFAQQMQSALQNQSTGVQAGSALGNVGAQGLSGALTTGSAQMNAPFQGLTNYSNLVNSVNVPGTVSQQNQMSPLSMLGSLSNTPATANNLLSNLGITGSTLSSLGNKFSNLFNTGNFSSTSNGGSGLPTGVTESGLDPITGLPTYQDSSGTAVDMFGNPAPITE